jgi:hypothetical protein
MFIDIVMRTHNDGAMTKPRRDTVSYDIIIPYAFIVIAGN